MYRTWGGLALALAGLAVSAGAAAAQAVGEPAVEARVWLDRGDEPVVNRGDRVRVYYRTNADGYVSIFHIDTNGTVRLLFPSSPAAEHFVRGGRDYRLLFPRASAWYVDDDPGVGYFFILASPEPLDFRDFEYSRAADGWDLSFVGRTVFDDPFVAMDEYIARLIPDWEYADYALDWVEYDVGGSHEYPRFLCYDCHGFSPYSVWNPYMSACTSFRVVIYNDPWYYPVNRYLGTRVVYVRPPIRGQPRYVFTNRRPGEPWTPVVRPRPSGGGQPGLPGDPAPRRSGAGIGSGGTAPPVSGRPAAVPGTVRLDPRARPSDARPGTGSAIPGARVAPRTGGAAGGGATTQTRPTLQRRPSGSGTASPPASGGSGTVRTIPRTSGGSAGTPSRSSGSSGPVIRRPPSTSGSGGARTPPRASGGSAVRTPPRSSGSATARPPTARPGGGTVQRSSGSARPAPARSSAGTRSAPPARKPPPRPRRPGGGG